MNITIQRRPLMDDSHLPADISPRLRQIYASRGVNSPTELDKSTQALLPPMGLKGMAQALALLETALRQQQRVLIVGDFDADGATSSALSVLALRAWVVGRWIFWCPIVLTMAMVYRRKS